MRLQLSTCKVAPGHDGRISLICQLHAVCSSLGLLTFLSSHGLYSIGEVDTEASLTRNAVRNLVLAQCMRLFCCYSD